MGWASYFRVSWLYRTTPAVLRLMTGFATLGALLSTSAILGFMPRFAASEALLSIRALTFASLRRTAPPVGIVSSRDHMMPFFVSNLLTHPTTLTSSFLPGSDLRVLFTPICGFLRADFPFMIAHLMAIGTSS